MSESTQRESNSFLRLGKPARSHQRFGCIEGEEGIEPTMDRVAAGRLSTWLFAHGGNGAS